MPHDIPGLVKLFNNNETFVNILDNFIGNSRSPKQGGKWKYGTFLANGWYWAGNEPDLLAPWLFPFAGAQYATSQFGPSRSCYSQSSSSAKLAMGVAPLAIRSSRVNESREGVGIVTRASIGSSDPIELSASSSPLQRGGNQ